MLIVTRIGVGVNGNFCARTASKGKFFAPIRLGPIWNGERKWDCRHEAFIVRTRRHCGRWSTIGISHSGAGTGLWEAQALHPSQARRRDSAGSPYALGEFSPCRIRECMARGPLGAGIAKTRAIEGNSHYLSNKCARSFDLAKFIMNELASALPKPKDGCSNSVSVISPC